MENENTFEQLDMIEEGSDSYKVKLDNFEGPLDLLYQLMKDAKMDIFDIKLSLITEQYLEYMDQIPELDMEKASGFIEVAATLIEIKSKKLLPKPDELVVDEEDPEELLKRRMQEYALFKEASENLHNIENVDRLYKQPDPKASKYRIVLKDMVLDGLLDAFSNILAKTLEKKEEIVERKIARDRFTVAEKIAAIKNAVLIKPKVYFSELIGGEELTKSEVINVFLALLELLKLQIIKARQVDNFTEIEIEQYDDEQDELSFKNENDVQLIEEENNG